MARLKAKEEKKNKKREADGVGVVAEPPDPPVAPPRKRHKWQAGVCVACQQHQRMKMQLISKVSASHGTGGPCIA